MLLPLKKKTRLNDAINKKNISACYGENGEYAIVLRDLRPISLKYLA